MNEELDAFNAFNAGYTRGHKTGYESGKKAGAEQARREADAIAAAKRLQASPIDWLSTWRMPLFVGTPDLRDLIGRRFEMKTTGVDVRRNPTAAPASTPTRQFEVGVSMSARARSDESKSGARRGEVEVRIVEKTPQGEFLHTGRAFCDIEDKWASTTGLKLAWVRAMAGMAETAGYQSLSPLRQSIRVRGLAEMLATEFAKITFAGGQQELLLASLKLAWAKHQRTVTKG